MNILLFGATGDGPRGALGVRGRARRLRRVLLLPRRLLGRHGGAGLPARDVRPHARRRADARRRESPDDVRLRLGSRHGRHRARAGVFPLLNASFPNQMTTTERVPVLVPGGPEALEWLSADRDRIAAVVLDLAMPGMDGRACFRMMRKARPELVVLVSSGFTRNGRAEELLAEGAAGFVQKPYRTGELARALAAALAPRGPARSQPA